MESQHSSTGVFLEYMQIVPCNSLKSILQNSLNILASLAGNFVLPAAAGTLDCFEPNRYHFVKMNISVAMVRMVMCHLYLFMPQQKGNN